MSFDASVYNGLLIDLVTTVNMSTATLQALLLNSSYSFDQTDGISDLSGYETSGSGYARSSTANFSISGLNNEQQFRLSQNFTFSSFSTSDWRYVVVFNSSSNVLYACLDSGVTNVWSSAPFTPDAGGDPLVRLVAT